MDKEQMRSKGKKSIDVTPGKIASRKCGAKKSAEMLPKILVLAAAKGSLQTQRVKCGKANCKCARGELHEGYSYFFWRLGRHQLKWYVRRGDVAVVRAVIEERVRRDVVWRLELSEARAFLRRMMSATMGVKL